MRLGIKEILLIIVPLLCSFALTYCVYLAGLFIVTPAEKRVALSARAADNALSGNAETAYRLAESVFPDKNERFSLRPIKKDSFIASFDNTLIYEKLASAEEEQPLQEKTVENSENTPPRHKISSILKGENKDFAVINGKIYHKGDNVSKDEYIKRIDANRILFDGKWGERWITVSF